jgi:hypothetical protein
MLPSATITGVTPDSKYVAWNGEQYVFRHTQESVLADERLMLIGRVKELNVDGSSALTTGKDRVVRTATPHQKRPSKGRPASVVVATRREILRKLSATGVTERIIAKLSIMRNYLRRSIGRSGTAVPRTT